MAGTGESRFVRATKLMACKVRILAGRVDRSAGSHVYHQELTRRFAARGHRVSLVCFEATPEALECAEVHEVPKELYIRSVMWRFSSFMTYRQSRSRLLHLDLPPADVVIAGEHLFLKAHWKKFPQTPWIYLPHSLVMSQEIQSYQLPPVMNWVSTRVYEHLQMWALRHADRTLRFSQQACDALSRYYGNSVRPRFTINPMGVELPRAVERRPIVYPLKLLWVGQLIPRKRIDIALEMLAKLRQYSWIFDVVGDGLSREALERHSRGLGLQDRVRFHGFQADPLTWYRAADLLLFPSWLENSPLTMLEAMSCGVPCLALSGDGIHFHNANSEIIENGVDGFLADSDEDFLYQLERILKQPEVLRKTGDAARETITRRHTWEKHLDRYEELFSELIQERRGRNGGREPRGVAPRRAEGISNRLTEHA
jgi:glycosyltransferase involved in cell wall biosynthesis